MKEETSYARQLYLFGEGKQKPVKNVKRLAELSGASVSTIQNHVGEWRSEAESLAIRCENSPYTLALSTEVLAQHRTEIEFLGKQVVKLRKRVEKTSTHHANYHVYLSSYQSALTKWEKSSGIMAHFDTASAAMRESAKATARAKAKLVDTKGPGPRRIDSSRFDVEG